MLLGGQKWRIGPSSEAGHGLALLLAGKAEQFGLFGRLARARSLFGLNFFLLFLHGLLVLRHEVVAGRRGFRRAGAARRAAQGAHLAAGRRRVGAGRRRAARGRPAQVALLRDLPLHQPLVDGGLPRRHHRLLVVGVAVVRVGGRVGDGLRCDAAAVVTVLPRRLGDPAFAGAPMPLRGPSRAALRRPPMLVVCWSGR